MDKPQYMTKTIGRIFTLDLRQLELLCIHVHCALCNYAYRSKYFDFSLAI